MAIPDVLRQLLSTPGPSGYETAAAKVFRDNAAAFASVGHDTHGSTVATVAGTGEGVPSLAVVGHIDEIGLIVQHIDDEGFLWFAPIGGWDPVILVGQRVRVLTKDGEIPGVVGKKAIHLLSPDERKKVPELKGLHIDIGAADGAEAKSKVRIGDAAVIDAEPVELLGDRVVSRSMDNRLGSFVAFEVARLVAESGGAPGDVHGVAVVQEEIGLAGAKTTAYSLNPGCAIAVDVTHATDIPDVSKREQGDHKLGSGPVISRGVTLHPAITGLLAEVAEAEGIPYTMEATTGRTGTDADNIAVTRGAIPTGLISIPLRYMHSTVEMCDLRDVHNSAKLIAAFAQRLSPETSFLR